MRLTDMELSALEKYSAGAVRWRLIEKIPFKRFAEDILPTALIIFGGTYIAKTVIDGESVWAIVSERKGKFFYGSYADTLKVLLASL